MDFDGSGTTRSMSSSMMFPNPWHVGQAPNGLLNENSRGCGASYVMPHGRHSKRSENWCTLLTGGWRLETGGCRLGAGGWWLVAGGSWLVAGGWCLVVGA